MPILPFYTIHDTNSTYRTRSLVRRIRETSEQMAMQSPRTPRRRSAPGSLAARWRRPGPGSAACSRARRWCPRTTAAPASWRRTPARDARQGPRTPHPPAAWRRAGTVTSSRASSRAHGGGRVASSSHAAQGRLRTIETDPATTDGCMST